MAPGKEAVLYTLTIQRAEVEKEKVLLEGLGLAEATLEPAFDPGQFQYTAQVDADVSSVTVEPVAAEGVNVRMSPSDADRSKQGHQVALNPGDNLIVVFVGLPGQRMISYGITVTRAEATETALTSAPNPFNPTTTIRYALPEAAEVRLVVLNMLGQQVKSLVADHQQAGAYAVVWNATDESAQPVSGGVYFLHLRVGRTITKVEKVLLVK